MSFALWFEDVFQKPAKEVLALVHGAEKTPVGELRIYDLLCDRDRPLLWGVYFFYSPDGQCLYVGKNSAQKFVQRIPAHFALLPTDWMNHLLRRICKFEGIETFPLAAESARRHMLLLMPISEREQKQHIGPLEKFFRLFAAPKYNSLDRNRKRYQRIDLALPLVEVLKQM